jgi:PAS domain S-box-containing protein
MLNKIINNPDLEKYMITFKSGQIIFLEGDDSQDLYILVSGQLDILKGNRKLADISEPGNLFGEMSFLLGARRTATAKAREDGKALRIPKEEISEFLEKFPEVTEDVTMLLARRLDETSQILYGLKEFCDQLPDAVILTDREGKILTWNSIAENMYGRTWEDMHHKSAKEIYEEPQDYMGYLGEVQSRYSVREKILKIRHPEKGTRFISTSTTVLFDGHHNFQGLLSLGRDVTRFKKMENRYYNVWKWIIPFFILLCFLAAAVFFTLPYFKRDSSVIRDTIKPDLRNQLGKDYLLLKSLLGDQFASRDRLKTNQLMKDFFDIQENEESPYLGLVLLDENLIVFDAYSIKAGATGSSEMIGSSYAGIEFQGDERSLHRVLTLYRTDKDHPMGRKGIEVAFEMSKDNKLTGWLIFQVDPELLDNIYGVNEDDLKKFQFKKS